MEDKIAKINRDVKKLEKASKGKFQYRWECFILPLFVLLLIKYKIFTKIFATKNKLILISEKKLKLLKKKGENLPKTYML